MKKSAKAKDLFPRMAVLPREVDTRKDDWRKQAWNLDYAWFTPAEARSIVPEPRAVGSQYRSARAQAWGAPRTQGARQLSRGTERL